MEDGNSPAVGPRRNSTTALKRAGDSGELQQIHIARTTGGKVLAPGQAIAQ